MREFDDKYSIVIFKYVKLNTIGIYSYGWHKREEIMIKRTWRKLNRIVSAPILCYLTLLLLSFILIGVSLGLSENNTFGNILVNFGYGIFGSTFVAILIDYGATIRQSKNDQKDFFLFTKDLKEAIKIGRAHV